MAKVSPSYEESGVRYAIGGTSVLLFPKRKNRWQCTAQIGKRVLANANVLDPGDSKQRDAFLLAGPPDLSEQQQEDLKQLLLHASQELEQDTRKWMAWTDERKAQRMAEAIAKAEADRARERDEYLDQIEPGAREVLGDPRLLFNIGEAITARGLVGERENALMLELGMVSRVTDDPLCAVVKGDSAGGKSHQVKSVLALHPDSAHIDLTSASERGLVYDPREYAHKTLCFYEMDGQAASPFAAYLLRTLISEGCIRYLTVETSGPVPAGTLIVKEGPIGFLSTTTEPALEHQQETRTLSLQADDSQEQTKRVLKHQAQRVMQSASIEDPTPWRDAHEWLAEKGLRQVVIPFADRLPEHMPSARVRVRRDFPRLLNLIGASALLHQVQREHSADGQSVVASLADYAMVRTIAQAAIGRSMQGLGTRTLELVSKVTTLYASKAQAAKNKQQDVAGVSVSYTELVKATRLPKYTITRWLAPAILLGVLDNRTEGQNGKAAQLLPGAYAVDDLLSLPSVVSVALDDELVAWFDPLNGSPQCTRCTDHCTDHCNALSGAEQGNSNLSGAIFKSQMPAISTPNPTVAPLHEEAEEEYFSPPTAAEKAKNNFSSHTPATVQRLDSKDIAEIERFSASVVETVAPATAMVDATVGAELTAEARQLLEKITQGNAVPAYMTSNLKRIAAANGVTVNADMTPNLVIDALKVIGIGEVVKNGVADSTAANDDEQGEQGDPEEEWTGVGTL
jgi:hypothetical protein